MVDGPGLCAVMPLRLVFLAGRGPTLGLVDPTVGGSNGNPTRIQLILLALCDGRRAAGHAEAEFTVKASWLDTIGAIHVGAVSGYHIEMKVAAAAGSLDGVVGLQLKVQSMARWIGMACWSLRG